MARKTNKKVNAASSNLAVEAPKVSLDENQVYQFCMSWIHEDSREELIKQFNSNKWNFEEFHKLAIGNSWYDTSMSILSTQ